jgi:hypothetical protein
MATIASLSARLERLEQQLGAQVCFVLSFKRDPARFAEAVADLQCSAPSRTHCVERLLANHAGELRETLELVLDGVPDEAVQGVYDRAIGTALAASERGEGETLAEELVNRPHASDVSEATNGRGVNLDLEQEEQDRLLDAAQRVEAHNRKIRERWNR